MKNIYILKLEQKLSQYNGQYYHFNGANGKVRWPMEDGAFLGETGAWNFFWRLGFQPQLIAMKDLVNISAEDIIVVCATNLFNPEIVTFLKSCLSRGALLIASGNPQAWEPFLGSVQSCRYDHPYAALAYLVNEKVWLMAPPAWTYMQQESGNEGFEAVGQLAAIHGERQTPERALVTPLPDAPAILKKGNFVYLNANPFAAFQAWLQGQEDLQPWMLWRHRMFWLDEWVADLNKILSLVGIDLTNLTRTGIDGLGETTIVLRHDLDSSRDTSYLEEENKRGFPAVYAILNDKNTGFWVNQLAKYPQHEKAYHYNTLASSILKTLYFRLTKTTSGAYRPGFKDIVGKNLQRQARWAIKNGVAAETLHRHGSFMIYPEWIDAMDEVLNEYPHITGSSSLFRGHLLRWGVDRVDTLRGHISEFPDVHFPLWYPFRIAHAGYAGKMLKGWECTTVMEIEPQFFKQLISYKMPELPQRIVTLNFHPAHACTGTFTSSGSLRWFKDILDIIGERDIRVETLGCIYKKASECIA
ncbi:MAG: hypothetical protein GXY40_03850 [Syntrophomonadaceae bacterium]|nr:hypothetical protein [Syntrophomonadaceae bacterium]